MITKHIIQALRCFYCGSLIRTNVVVCSSQIKQFRDFIGLLPEKIGLKILGYLKPKDLIKAMRVGIFENSIDCMYIYFKQRA